MLPLAFRLRLMLALAVLPILRHASGASATQWLIV